MKKKKYYYKRTVKRITKMVQYYIDNLDTLPFLSTICVNPHTSDVRLNDEPADEPYFIHAAVFFTDRIDKDHRVPDLRSIEHWVLVDLKRFAAANPS